MSVIILGSNTVLGPFKIIETLDDRLRADNTDYPFTVIGEYQISEDDSLAPLPVVPTPSIADYTAAMEEFYDVKAAEKNYGAFPIPPRVMCALRAGIVGSPFQNEGLTFGAWMDTCNKLVYQIMSEVLSGQRPAPTIPELLSEMPILEWPV